MMGAQKSILESLRARSTVVMELVSDGEFCQNKKNLMPNDIDNPEDCFDRAAADTDCYVHPAGTPGAPSGGGVAGQNQGEKPLR